MMRKLTNKQYWDVKLKKIINHYDYNRFHYIEYLFPILDHYLTPGSEKGNVFELGFVPGQGLMKFCHRYGFTPNGADFSSHVKVVAELIQKKFSGGHFFEFDFNKNNIKSLGTYDVVLSNGFIEHFFNYDDIVAKQIDLLEPRGLLIISTPNLNLLRIVFWFIFDWHLLKAHNPHATNIHLVKKSIESHGCTVLRNGFFGNPHLWLENYSLLARTFGEMIMKITKVIFLKFPIPNSIRMPYVFWIARKNAPGLHNEI